MSSRWRRGPARADAYTCPRLAKRSRRDLLTRKSANGCAGGRAGIAYTFLLSRQRCAKGERSGLIRQHNCLEPVMSF